MSLDDLIARFDPADPDFIADPYPVLNAIREAGIAPGEISHLMHGTTTATKINPPARHAQRIHPGIPCPTANTTSSSVYTVSVTIMSVHRIGPGITASIAAARRHV